MSEIFYCAFCGKSQNEVFMLVAGPTSFICNECIKLCSEIVAEKVAVKSDAIGAPILPRAHA